MTQTWPLGCTGTHTHIHTHTHRSVSELSKRSGLLKLANLFAITCKLTLMSDKTLGERKPQMTGNQKCFFSPTVWDGTRMNRAFLCHLEAENAQDEGKLLWSTRYFHINFEITHRRWKHLPFFFVLSQFNYFCFHPLYRAFWWGCLSCPETFSAIKSRSLKNKPPYSFSNRIIFILLRI